VSEFAEMLRSQMKAINEAYLQGLAHGRINGYREGRAAGLEEARQMMQAQFPNMQLPETLES